MDQSETTFSVELLIPSEKITRIKRLLEREFGSEFNTPPHLTIAVSPLLQEYIQQVDKDIEEFCKIAGSVHVKTLGLRYQSDRHFFALHVDENSTKDLHEEITAMVNKYRSGVVRKKDVERVQTDYYTEKEKQMLHTFGFAKAGDEFYAHITLGNIKVNIERFEQNLDELKRGLLDLENTTFVVDTVRACFYKDIKSSKNEILWEKLYSLK